MSLGIRSVSLVLFSKGRGYLCVQSIQSFACLESGGLLFSLIWCRLGVFLQELTHSEVQSKAPSTLAIIRHKCDMIANALISL